MNKYRRRRKWLNVVDLQLILDWLIIAVMVALCIRFVKLKSDLENRIQELDLKIEIQTVESKLESENRIQNWDDVMVIEDGDLLGYIPEPHYWISESDRETVIAIVAGESRGETLKGKQAVAQTILNSMLYEQTDVHGVRWKFDGYQTREAVDAESWTECEIAVGMVFDQGNMAIEGQPLFFHSGPSKWHETSPNLRFLCQIGNHKFYELKEGF